MVKVRLDFSTVSRLLTDFRHWLYDIVSWAIVRDLSPHDACQAATLYFPKTLSLSMILKATMDIAKSSRDLSPWRLQFPAAQYGRESVLTTKIASLIQSPFPDGYMATGNVESYTLPG